mgnify:CR=1 FL=1
MFDEFFKKVFKSRKLLKVKEIEELQKKISALREDIIQREIQIDRFKKLMVEDPSHKDKYKRRTQIHSEIIKRNRTEIQKIEIKLLDA